MGLFPGDVDPGGVDEAARGVDDLGTDAVTGDQGHGDGGGVLGMSGMDHGEMVGEGCRFGLFL
jgi:hypothetical protein